MLKKSVVSIAVVLFVVLAVAPMLANASPKAGTKFIVISPHTQEQCLKALDGFAADAPAMLAKFEWGCMAGDHTGYAIVEAADEAAVRAMLPAGERAQAKVVKLNKFTQEQIKSFHQKM